MNIKLCWKELKKAMWYRKTFRLVTELWLFGWTTNCITTVSILLDITCYVLMLMCPRLMLIKFVQQGKQATIWLLRFVICIIRTLFVWRDWQRVYGIQTTVCLNLFIYSNIDKLLTVLNVESHCNLIWYMNQNTNEKNINRSW